MGNPSYDEVNNQTQNDSLKNKSRQAYFDFLRGIAIIMVVAIHTISEVYTNETITFFAISIRQVFNIAVPIFCASSAYFLINKPINKYNYFLFLRKRITRVYLPLLLFSFPYFLNDIAKSQNIVKAILKLVTCSYSVYYFVALIIQFYILLPLFQRFKVLRNLFVGFIISFIWVVLYTYLVSPNISLPLIVYGGVIVCFWSYFSIASSISKDKVEIKPIVLYVLTIISLILCIIESYNLLTRSGTLTGIGLKPSVVIFSSLVILLLYSKPIVQRYKQNKLTEFLEILGKYSFGIYLGHLYVMRLLLPFIIRIYKGQLFSRGLEWLLLTIAVLCITFCLLWIAKKIFPKISRLFLGV